MVLLGCGWRIIGTVSMQDQQHNRDSRQQEHGAVIIPPTVSAAMVISGAQSRFEP